MAASFLCVSCKLVVDTKHQALQCELCGLWEHLVCIRENDRSSKELYTLLCQTQCNALWTVCSQCHSKTPLAHRIRDLESQVLVLEERAQTANAVLEERGHFVEHLQREVLEVKSEKERYNAMMEQQNLQLQLLIT